MSPHSLGWSDGWVAGRGRLSGSVDLCCACFLQVHREGTAGLTHVYWGISRSWIPFLLKQKHTHWLPGKLNQFFTPGFRCQVKPCLLREEHWGFWPWFACPFPLYPTEEWGLPAEVFGMMSVDALGLRRMCLPVLWPSVCHLSLRQGITF